MDSSQIVQQALEAHRKLDREVEILKLRLAAQTAGSLADWMVNCTTHFQEFRRMLNEHLKMEEEGGFMTVVRDRRPTLSARIDELMDEHHVMRRACGEIEDFLGHHPAPSPDEVARVRQMVEALLDRLQRHEVTENTLVQEAFTQDIGTGD